MLSNITIIFTTNLFCHLQNGKSVISMQVIQFNFFHRGSLSFILLSMHSPVQQTKPLFSKKSAHVHFVLNENCTSLCPKAWSLKNLNSNSSETFLEAVDSEARPAHPVFCYFLLFSQSICLHGPKKVSEGQKLPHLLPQYLCSFISIINHNCFFFKLQKLCICVMLLPKVIGTRLESLLLTQNKNCSKKKQLSDVHGFLWP